MTMKPNLRADARERQLVAAQGLPAGEVAAASRRQVLARGGVGRVSLDPHFPLRPALARASVGQDPMRSAVCGLIVLLGHTGDIVPCGHGGDLVLSAHDRDESGAGPQR